MYSKNVKSCDQFFQDVCRSLATVQLRFNAVEFLKKFSQSGYKVFQLFFSLYWDWKILKSTVKDIDNILYLLSIGFCFLLCIFAFLFFQLDPFLLRCVLLLKQSLNFVMNFFVFKEQEQSFFN